MSPFYPTIALRETHLLGVEFSAQRRTARPTGGISYSANFLLDAAGEDEHPPGVKTIHSAPRRGDQKVARAVAIDIT
jgi:hypothetical protein